jgi:hypothetical protein
VRHGQLTAAGEKNLGMANMGKVTVTVPVRFLGGAQEPTGESISETVRIGLRYLLSEYNHPLTNVRL